MVMRIEQGQSLGKKYNPNAYYVRCREHFVNWILEHCIVCKHSKNTTYHAVGIFDAFMQRLDNLRYLQSITFFKKNSERNILTFIAAVCVFISVKYHEMQYPGIDSVLEAIKSPFTYDQFVYMEKEILIAMDWRLQLISTYDVLTHFFCQGILFTNDRVKDEHEKKSVLI